MAVENNAPIYPIGVASRLLSLHPRTLRIYEEAGLVKPVRRGNKRYYSNDDIDWIRCLRTLIHDKGISIPGIKMLLEYTPCWKITNCPAATREKCSAYQDRTIPCWQLTGDVCAREHKRCEGCEVYIKALKEAGGVAGP